MLSSLNQRIENRRGSPRPCIDLFPDEKSGDVSHKYSEMGVEKRSIPRFHRFA